MYKCYFVTYFLYFVQYIRCKFKKKVDTFIHFCFFSRVRVYTKKLVKVATFFIWVYSSGRFRLKESVERHKDKDPKTAEKIKSKIKEKEQEIFRNGNTNHNTTFQNLISVQSVPIPKPALRRCIW